MKRIAAVLACLSALFVGTPPAIASVISYNVVLSGSQSVPPSATTAFGNATVTVDNVADTVFVMLSFTGLIGGPAVAAHIHCCVATTGTAAVVIPFTAFPNATSGIYSNTFTTPAVIIAGIEAGLAYINIHDALFPGGEIRGNILPAAATVPEPEPLVLIGLGMLALVGMRRRRARMAAPRDGFEAVASAGRSTT